MNPSVQKEITIPTKDGESFTAFVAYPDNMKEKVPALVVIQEIFGVNDGMRNICKDLAAEGYIAICPDLFWRQEPNIQISDNNESEWARAFELFKGFDVDLGVNDLKSTLDFIRKDPNCTGKVGTIGYCLGGQLAYLMSARSDADCNVSYYGVSLDGYLDEAENIKNPLLLHIAEKDEYVPHEAQNKIVKALKDIPHVAINIYSGVNHAFARIGGKHYKKETADKANALTKKLLTTFLK